MSAPTTIAAAKLQWVQTEKPFSECSPEEDASAELFASARVAPTGDGFNEDLAKFISKGRVLSQTWDIDRCRYRYVGLTTHPNTLLLDAVDYCNTNTFRELCARVKKYRSQFAFLLETTSDSVTLLSSTAASGCYENLQILIDALDLQYDTEVNRLSKNGYPIDYAVSVLPFYALFHEGDCGSKEVAERLQKGFFDLDDFPEGDFTIKFKGNLAIVRRLLQRTKNLDTALELVSDLPNTAKRFVSSHASSPLTVESTGKDTVTFSTIASNRNGDAFPKTRIKVIYDFRDLQAEITAAHKRLDGKKVAEFKARQELEKLRVAEADAQLLEVQNKLALHQEEMTAKMFGQAERKKLHDAMVQQQQQQKQLDSLEGDVFDLKTTVEMVQASNDVLNKHLEGDIARKATIDNLRKNKAHLYHIYTTLSGDMLTMLSKARHGKALEDQVKPLKVVASIAKGASAWLSFVPLLPGLVKLAASGLEYYSDKCEKQKNTKVRRFTPVKQEDFSIDVTLAILRAFPEFEAVSKEHEEAVANVCSLLVFAAMSQLKGDIDPNSPELIKLIVDEIRTNDKKEFRAFRDELATLKKVSASQSNVQAGIAHQAMSPSAYTQSRPVSSTGTGLTTTTSSSGKPAQLEQPFYVSKPAVTHAFGMQQEQQLKAAAGATNLNKASGGQAATVSKSTPPPIPARRPLKIS